MRYLGVFIAAAAFGALLCLWPGDPRDSLYLPYLAVSHGWAEELRRIGLHPFIVSLWKLAVAADPEEPVRWVRPVTMALHAANSVFVLWFLSRWVRPTIALAGAALFVFYRPGDLALLWPATTAEVLSLFFGLPAYYLWCKGAQRPALRWGSAALATLATVAKSSAVLIPFVLLAHVLWIEGDEAPGDERESDTAKRLEARSSLAERLRASAPMLATAFVLCAAVAVRAHLGFLAEDPAYVARHRFSDGIDVIDGLWGIGATLVRMSVLFVPPPLGHARWAGLVVVALCAWVLLQGSNPVRFGLLWAGAWISPAVMLRGGIGFHYSYPGVPGILLILCFSAQRLSARSEAARRAVIAAAAVFFLLNGFLYFRDAARAARLGALAREMRAVVRSHEGDARAASKLLAVNRPHEVRPVEVLFYDFRLETLPVEDVPDCAAAPEAPCLRWPAQWEGDACRADPSAPCVRWIAPTPGAAE